MKKTRFFCIGDLLPILLCVAATLVLPLMHVFADEASILRVETPQGVQTYALDTDGTIFVDGENDIELTLLILDGKVCVAEANCPDQVCVHTGRLSRDGDTAACVPANILLTVEGENTADGPDAVAR